MLLLASSLSAAPPSRSAGPPLGTSVSIEAAYLQQFETYLDDGGDFSVGRLFVQGGVNHTLANDFSAGLSVGGGQDSYNLTAAPASAAWSVRI